MAAPRSRFLEISLALALSLARRRLSVSPLLGNDLVVVSINDALVVPADSNPAAHDSLLHAHGAYALLAYVHRVSIITACLSPPSRLCGS
jgi:hypothetical protein